jgi:hypothetical protein
MAQAVAEACTIAAPDPLIRRYPVSTIWQFISYRLLRPAHSEEVP